MPKNIITPGDQFAEKGTTPWADWQRSRLKHALKHVHFEARDIVKVIRDMCEGESPAWHLMTRRNGLGFRTFEEFVTSPEGLAYPDYAKFRGIAISEPGIMNEREYDLLTAAPDGRRDNKRGGKDDSSATRTNHLGATRVKQLRAISRAPGLVRQLFTATPKPLIDAKLAELLGPDEPDAERKAKVNEALAAIRAIVRNGNDAAYRKAVNDAVRRVFGKAAPTADEKARKAFLRLSAKEQKAFLRWANKAVEAE